MAYFLVASGLFLVVAGIVIDIYLRMLRYRDELDLVWDHFEAEHPPEFDALSNSFVFHGIRVAEENAEVPFVLDEEEEAAYDAIDDMGNDEDREPFINVSYG